MPRMLASVQEGCPAARVSQCHVLTQHNQDRGRWPAVLVVLNPFGRHPAWVPPPPPHPSIDLPTHTRKRTAPHRWSSQLQLIWSMEGAAGARRRCRARRAASSSGGQGMVSSCTQPGRRRRPRGWGRHTCAVGRARGVRVSLKRGAWPACKQHPHCSGNSATPLHHPPTRTECHPQSPSNDHKVLAWQDLKPRTVSSLAPHYKHTSAAGAQAYKQVMQLSSKVVKGSSPAQCRPWSLWPGGRQRYSNTSG